jgi:diguanylate cyclase (GGDEF)-like protein/PAS domain S-box-containing protein
VYIWQPDAEMSLKPKTVARPSWTTRGRWNLWVAVMVGAACAIVWVVTIERAQHEYAAAIGEAEEQNSNLAIALEEHTIRSLESVNQLLILMSRAYLRDGERFDLEGLFDVGAGPASMVVNVGVADEQGRVVSSRGPSTLDTSGESQLVLEHREQPDSDMLIRPPTISRRSGEWTILVSKRIAESDGSLGGVAFVTVNPHYFTQFYRQENLGREGLIVLVGLDGIVRARRVGDVETFGQDMRTSALLAQQARQPVGTFIGFGIDGVERVYSYRTLSQYPMVVSVATSRNEVLAGFRGRRRNYYLGAAVATALIVFGAVAFVRVQARQRRTMADLSRQRTVLTTMQQTLLDALLLVDNEGRIVSFNHKFVEIWRVPEELVLAGDEKAVLEYGTDKVEDPEAFFAKVGYLYEHRDEPSHDEFRFLDGRTIDRYSAPVVGSDGTHYGRVWLFRDITERRKQDEDLRRTQQRFHQLADSIEQVFWIATPDLQSVTYVSPAFERVTGRPAEEFIADWRTWLESVHPDDRQILVDAHAKLAAGIPYDIEYRSHHADGREIWINARGYPLRDAAGTMIHATGVAADITSRKHAEEQLRLSARAFESIADGIIVTDAARNIVSVNKSYCSMTGYEPKELIGKRPRIFQSGRHDAEFYDEVWKSIDTEGHWRGELWSRRSNGDTFPEMVSIGAVKDRAGTTTHYVGVCTDISEVKRYEAQLEHQARHDVLTGLPNRVLFEERFTRALAEAHRSATKTGVLFIDLDHFKHVNDSLGHAAGDSLLHEWARRLSATVRRSDTVARFSGDEFAVLLEAVSHADMEGIAGKALAALASPFHVSGHDLFLSASIGISLYPDDGTDAATLLKNADTALYRAKMDGRNDFRFFSADMNARALENLMMTNALRVGLARDELEVRYQPCVDLASGRIESVEALVAWRHPELGLLPPGRFIPLAEETGLIEALGERVLEIACRQMGQWQADGFTLSRMAVNLSARQFRLPDLPQRIAAVLAATGIRGDHLEIEVTEGIVMQNPEAASGLLMKLKSMGILIAVDDFGTGYSSLSYLKNLPLDFLKIDRSFVSGVPGAADDVAIIRAIIAMAKSLGLRLIAEGVETEEQRAFLASHGCDEAQGWLFGKALPGIEITALLTAG